MKKFMTLAVTLFALGCPSLLSASEALDSSGEYLGCTVDRQQCALRAANHGYSSYHAEPSYLCSNAAKFACWGNHQVDENFSEVFDEADAYANCAYYVKPATCVSHSECKWVGSCVPR